MQSRCDRACRTLAFVNQVRLRSPDLVLLPQYLDALRRGWTPEADDDPEGAGAILRTVEADPVAFVRWLFNPGGGGPPVELDDGTLVPRLAYVRYWIWTDGYCGEVGLRWRPGTSELPPYCDGHVGYAVVPWKRGSRLAAASVRELMPIARGFGLRWLDISMSAANAASIRVAETVGAVLQEEYVALEQGGIPARRYRLWMPDG